MLPVGQADALRLLDPAQTEGPIANDEASYFLSKLELATATPPQATRQVRSAR